MIDAGGNRTGYEYDGFNRLSKTFYPSPTIPGTSSTTDFEQLTYDAASNVVSRRLRDGQVIGLAYDDVGRMTIKDLPGTEPTVIYTYDLLDRLITAAGSPARSFTYDALGRNLTQTSPQGTVSLEYDLAGRRTRLTYPGTGLYVDYDHLLTNEVTRIRENGATSGVGVLATYAYDNLGRRTSLTRGNGAVTTYSYDNASNLSQIFQNLSGTTSDLTLGFSFNPAGQMISNTRSNDAYAWNGHYAVNRNYTASGLNQYTASGSIVPTYDARGNLTSAGSTTYGYNSENMLISASGGVTLSYDPLLRLYQTVGGGVTTRMLYDGQSLIAEYNGSNGLQRRYVHGPGVDEPLVWYEGAGTTDRRWYHADERGSVIGVSNGSNAIMSLNAYDEYGIPQGTNVGRFQYTGQQWVSELGMYHYRARVYSPTLGRFLQTDPIGYEGGMNLYAYVWNDPINLTDPMGLAPLCLPIFIPNPDFVPPSPTSTFDPATGEEGIVVTGDRPPGGTFVIRCNESGSTPGFEPPTGPGPQGDDDGVSGFNGGGQDSPNRWCRFLIDHVSDQPLDIVAGLAASLFGISMEDMFASVLTRMAQQSNAGLGAVLEAERGLRDIRRGASRGRWVGAIAGFAAGYFFSDELERIRDEQLRACRRILN